MQGEVVVVVVGGDMAARGCRREGVMVGGDVAMVMAARGCEGRWW